ncbi:MAG: ribosome small subunit-dependent GTPase A [Candidatus Pacebacteria bacterium]|nr:ribosome small subunit-dependent GTPase A [Candidatus Paceibacterota bacterium]
MNTFTNEDLGYTNFFEMGRMESGLGMYSVARVISESRGGYRVKNEQGEYIGRVTGKHVFEATSREAYPAVGDWVAVSEPKDGHVLIHGILPRMSMLKRTYGEKNRKGEKDKTQIIAANIDVAFVIESVDRDYNLNRFERYFAIAHNSGVRPAIILNKVDLLSAEHLDERLVELRARFPDVDILTTSTVRMGGLDTLTAYLHTGKTYCFLGSSGVGKSSLINALLGEAVTKTGAIGTHSGRGKHVTTARHMYFLKHGGIVIDNPGVREVGMADVKHGIDTFFEDITARAIDCAYSDCSHTHEPNCAVVQAVNMGTLSREKYNNYVSLKKETAYAEMNDLQKKDKDRQFGKFLKKAKKELGDAGYEDFR